MRKEVDSCADDCVRWPGHQGACLLPRNEEMCSKCRGEGEVNGYLENACVCCGGGGCGPSTGCGCWHQGETCDHCGGMGIEPA